MWGSGSVLGVLPHDIKVLLVWYLRGLDLGSLSLDMSYCDALVLALFDGVARGAVAVDLYLFASSYNRSIRCLLLQGLRVLFHHPFINVYGHFVSSCKACKCCISGLHFIYIRAWRGVLERPLLSRPEGRSKAVVKVAILLEVL